MRCFSLSYLAILLRFDRGPFTRHFCASALTLVSRNYEMKRLSSQTVGENEHGAALQGLMTSGAAATIREDASRST